ncbi:uncharacterized protein LOC126299332 [Schistocerca gregaria]|uniref:uncharacterized protein LOC126299332 n=1 Tax=Schistocerca gregaria TaxID=7010 RepID=UPI00211DFA05|nr:uncharacterized protein LOC126299332 [Schistocerca gregaria]
MHGRRLSRLPLLLALLAAASANPLKDPKVCGRPTCTGGGKFKYLPNARYEYDYSIDVKTLFAGTSRNESTLHISAELSIEFISECDGMLKIEGISLRDDGNNDPDAAIAFSVAATAHPLRFSFQDGTISEVCPHPEETAWVLNFKNGILSALQNSMKRFDVDHETEEMDVNGNCPTHYSLVGAEKTTLIIKKVKEIGSCNNRYQHQSVIQTTPYSFRSNFQPLPIMKSNSSCQLHVDHNIYSKIDCEEVHLFQPFSYKQSGAKTIIHQVLTLTSESNVTIDDIDTITRRTSLSFDHIQTPKPMSADLGTSRDLLMLMCELNDDGVEPEFPDAFSHFIHIARLLSHDALQALYDEAPTLCESALRHMTDALPLLGSNAAVQVMTDAILEGDIPTSTANEWLFAMAFIPRPSLETITIMSPLLSSETSNTEALLSLSSVVHTYCKKNSGCENATQVQATVSHLQELVLSGCQNTRNNKIPYSQVIVALKTLGNIGVTNANLSSVLHNCLENEELPMELRVSAIETYRRFPCEPERDYFIDIYRDHAIDPEIRIAAYLQIMRCPNYIVIKTIKHALIEEEVNQVGSFVWSHLKNLLKSSNPNRVEIQGLLQDTDIGKKFSSDIRKFSHNYEGSVFVDEYNVGGNYEGNIIFSPRSYLPRSGSLNLTVDLFGHSINILELSGRMEGFEHYVETMFGPKGPFNGQKVKQEIHKRFYRSVNGDLKESVNSLPNVIDTNFYDPKASLGLKIFGNELKYGSIEGQDEVSELLRSLNPFRKLQQILSGKEVFLKKSLMFLDTNYVVPTGSGFPINLNAVGTAAVHLKMSGQLNITDFNSSGHLDLKGEIKPSVAIDVVGTMGLDAYYGKTGIKLKTNLYSSSAVEGQLKVRGTKLVSLSFSLPKQKFEIIKAQSELLVMKHGAEEQQGGIEEDRIQEKVCTWPSVDETLGLMVCADYQFPNTSFRTDVAAFILNGPTKFQIFLKKADPTAKKYLMEYKWDSSENSTFVSFIFDTPGSKLKRELSFKINLDKNSQNVTLLIHSGNNTYEALGKYKNTPNDKYLNFGLDVNGRKNFDAEISLKTRPGKYGNTYEPRFFLAINDTRIVELSGRVRWVEKRNISQCDVSLEFNTRKFFTKLFGYVKKTDTVLATSLRLDYRFKDEKPQSIKMEAKFISKTMTKAQGSIQLQSTAYPQFDFTSSLMFLRNSDRMDFWMEIAVGPHQKDIKSKFVLTTLIRFLRGHDNVRFDASVHISKPISSIDMRFSLGYLNTGPETSILVTVRYAPGKEVLIQFKLKMPHTSFTFFEAMFNLTLPGFNPMVVELKLHEKSPKEYDIEFSGSWFSGHSISGKGLYQDKSTSKTMNHHLKLAVKSPSFNELTVSFRLIQDDTEFKTNILVTHEDDKYSVLVKQVSPSTEHYEMYVEVRWIEKVYSLALAAAFEDYKEISLDLHIDQSRDIHLLLRGLNKPTMKEAGVEIEWDANRDPLKKFIIFARYDNSAFLNYSARFKLSYPGRSINAGVLFAAKDPVFESQAYLEWSPTEAISVKLGASYRYDTVVMVSGMSELLTPFANWKTTAASGRLYLEENLFHANGSVHWKDDQNVALNLFGDYSLSDELFICEFNTSVWSTVEHIPSLSGSFFHKQGNKKYETKIYLKYMPENIISVRSLWELEQSSESTNLTGTVSLISPFSSYRKGVLITRIHVDSDNDVTGVAELTMNRRKYTTTLKGHFEKLTNSFLYFNITTPIPNYSTIVGRFGYSEEERHLVALVKSPVGGLGVEVQFYILNSKNFDIVFQVLSPMEFLREAVIMAKLKPNTANFKVGWNKLILGFSGIWYYMNITNFEYSYKIYTPVERFEETGFTAKILYGHGLDFDMSLLLAGKKIGVKVKGLNKPRPPVDLQIANKKLNLLEAEEDDYYDDTLYEEALSWEGLVELDAVIYPTIKGFLEIDEKDTLYAVHGYLVLPNGTAEFYDDFDFIDYFTITNKLVITSPFTSFKEIQSDLDYKITETIFGLLFDLKSKDTDGNWAVSGMLLNYTALESTIYRPETHYMHMNIYTPFKRFKNVDVKAGLQTGNGLYHTNFNLSTDYTSVAATGNLKINGEYTEISGGMHLNSSILSIPTFNVIITRNFSKAGNMIGMSLYRLGKPLQTYKTECQWLVLNDTSIKASLKLLTPLEKLQSLESQWLVASNFDENYCSLNILIKHNVENEIKFYAMMTEDHLSAELNTPSKNLRHAVLQATISQVQKNNNLINANVNADETSYTLIGSIERDTQHPVKIVSRLSSPTKGETVSFTVDVAKKSYGYELTTVVTKANEKAEIHCDFVSKPGLEYSVNFKASSTHKFYKRGALTGKILICDNMNYTVEVTGETPFKDFEKIGAIGHYYFQKSSGALKAALNLPVVKGHLLGEWKWILKEDMKVLVEGSVESKSFTKHGTVEMFYQNIPSRTRYVAIGVDVNLNKGIWQFGTNASMKASSEKDVEMECNLKLPPPYFEVYTVFTKMNSTETYSYVDSTARYSTYKKRSLYGYSVLLDSQEEGTNGRLQIQWGNGQISEILNILQLKYINDLTDLFYSLKTPMYTEKTFIATALFKPLGKQQNMKANVYWPESNRVATADIDYVTASDMKGTVNSTTPFKMLPWAALNFLIKNESVNNVYNFEFIWPNNTALFNSINKWEVKNHATFVEGTINLEIPLATRHIGLVEYNYQETPLHQNGVATVKYNGEKEIDGKYNCVSESSAGFEKDIIDIELQNKYFPLGTHYVHSFEYSNGVDGLNLPTVDFKQIDLFRLDNRSAFSLSGDLNIRTTQTGQEIKLTAIHTNRTVELKTDYQYLDSKFWQKTSLHLTPDAWITCDTTFTNKTSLNKEEEHFEINFAYPRRNYTVTGHYGSDNNSLSSEVTLMWDKQADVKTVTGIIDWKRISEIPNAQHALIVIKHPSFEKDVTLNGHYLSNEIDIMNVNMDLEYSTDPEKKFSVSGRLLNNSDKKRRNYGFELMTSHPDTSLDLKMKGGMWTGDSIYSTNNIVSYRRSYLPLQTGELKAMYNSAKKEIHLEKRAQDELSFLKGKYFGKYPEYKVNGSVLKDKEMNATGHFYLNFDEKLVAVTVLNQRPDVLESFYVDGKIPDSRNTLLNVWREYDDVHVSDISFYLRLNHSRLITSKLLWRPDLQTDVQKGVEYCFRTFHEGINETIDYWRKYIRSETHEALKGVWDSAEPYLENFIYDLRSLRAVNDDFEEFKVFLNNSYNANEFYIKDIFNYFQYIIDKLSIREHIESLPKIVNEIWEMMGESGEAVRESILWIVDTIKNSYMKIMDFINSFLKGESTAQIAEMLENFAEKYDKFMKDLNVAIRKHIVDLWDKTTVFLFECWNKFLRTFEPSFVTFAHYVETAALEVSNEILDFLYQRRSEIVESPYFSKFANFTQDLDKIYKDLLKNDALTNIKKYSYIIYQFLEDKYFALVPFGKELKQVFTEIINEFKELRKLQSVNFVIEKTNELTEKVIWFYNYFDLGTKIQKTVILIHSKLTDMTQTALQAENRYREAKTKFIFEPENGDVELEQKLPMSWHAFNETPRFEEIPEYKKLSDMQNYFSTSNTTFWTLYYEYKSLIDPSNWLPPFKGHALIVAPQHFMTFDQKFFEFRGACSYLLSTDFSDRNFSILLVSDPVMEGHLYDIVLLIDDHVVQVDLFNDAVTVERGAITHLPAQVGDMYIYQETEIITIESARGVHIQCNLKFDLCSITLSGWHYGKTFGLLGTMDNEPINDFLTSYGKVETDVERFTQSWILEPHKCSSDKNFAIDIAQPNEKLRNLCQAFFKSKSSQFSTCFTMVDPTPFWNMCTNSDPVNENEACATAIAYMQACLLEHTPLRIPDTCVKCVLPNGTNLVEGDFLQLNGTSIPHSTDIVFIVEASECNKNIRENRNIDLLISTLSKELTDNGFVSNRFSLIVFGGDGVYDAPRSIVMNNKIFTSSEHIADYFNNVVTGHGNRDIFGAINYATKLIYRPGISKTFILLPCSECAPENMTLDYSALHQGLLDHGITLHILMNEEFRFEKPRLQKILYGIDGKTAFTKNDVKNLKGDKGLRRQVKLPKTLLGVCTALALETNGSVFMAKKLEMEKKNFVKKYLNVFSKRVVSSAAPFTCQACECTAHNNGVSYTECFPCEYPVPSHIDPEFTRDMDIPIEYQSSIDYTDDDDYY